MVHSPSVHVLGTYELSINSVVVFHPRRCSPSAANQFYMFLTNVHGTFDERNLKKRMNARSYKKGYFESSMLSIGISKQYKIVILPWIML